MHAPGFAMLRSCLVALTVSVAIPVGLSQTVQVGAGSYTTALPAGATAPQATVYRSYAGPVATHKFWTAKNWNPLTMVGGGPYVMFPQPLNVQTAANGLVIGYGPQVQLYSTTAFFESPEADLTLGVAGLNASSVPISAYSDWTADFDFGPITTRVGRGMPFVYATTNGSNPTVTFSSTPTVFSNSGNTLGVTIGSNNYGLFGPPGATWSGVGTTTLTCNLPSGHPHVSIAILPSQSALSDFATYAFSYPTNTQVSWSYNPSTSQVTTNYTVTTQAVEGTQTGFLQALYPPQYGSLNAAINTNYTYACSRGTLEVWRGATFTTVDTYHGVIPYLPSMGGYNAATLQSYLDAVVNEGNHFTGGDTYGVGKQFARVAHLLPLCEALNTTASMNDFTSLLGSLESAMQDWFTASAGKTSHVFYYDNNWGSLIGYPAGYGSDTSLNDHHFHYGYWIHAAGLVGLYDPNWVASTNWGGMVTTLAHDIANPVRGDSQFPFLRHFDVYEGNSWAAGAAPFGDGGNEESSSEAVNAWVGLILYASAIGDTQLRDTGIWLYTMETKAVQYYWFNNGPVKTFPSTFTRTAVANLFDDKADTGTWFGSQIEYEHGIEFLPYTGGSAYLGRDTAYCRANWNEILQFEGTSTFNPATANWPDLMEEYEAFFDPASAISQWNSTTSTFDGETKAHEYYWLYNLQSLGNVDYAVTANTPLYAVYQNPSTHVVTHVAYNPTASAISVTFSDGKVLSVAAKAMATDSSTVTPPGAPSGLTASAASSSQINLSWSPSATSGVTYSVFRSTSSGFTASAANQVASGISGTSYSDTGLSGGTTYYYLVQAVNGAGNSASSNQASATTQTGVTVPAAPTGLAASAASSSQINLSWTASTTSGVTYSVFRGTASGFTASSSTQIASGITATSYSDTGLSAATTYYYLVEAVNSAGNSPASNQASATTQSSGGTNVGNTLYVRAGATSTVTGALSFTAGSAAASDTIPADNGTNYDGTPHAPLTYLVSNVSGTYSGAATQFSLFVDSLTAVGNGVQVQIKYDFTGSGTWGRVETYHYFATDPATGWENYSQNQGLESSSGSFANLSNGKIEILVWNAIGLNPAYLNASSPSASQSIVVIPFSSVTQGGTAPAAPTNLAASAASSSQINLSWTASSTSGATYTVFRSTTSGFAASSANQIASGVAGTSYSDTGLAASTTYYYLVQAVASGLSSGSSNQASATTQSGTTSNSSVYISCGGPASGSFAADEYFSGGTVASPSTATIDTSLLSSPVPPQSVLQHERYGAMTYTIPGLTAGKTYTVTLLFAELYWSGVNQRQFNVLLNGTQVLTNFDIYANAGAKNKAIQENFTATANASGQIVIQFTVGAYDQPKIDGIEVY